MAIVKSKLLKQLSENYPNFLKKDLEKFTNIILSEIKRTLKRGDRVELRGFGVFSTNIQKARISRNPKTGESVDVPAKFVVTFKPGKEMEEKIREANPVGWNLETFQLPQGETPTPSDSDNSEQSLPPI